MIAILAALVIGGAAVAAKPTQTIKLWPDNDIQVLAPEGFGQVFTIDTGDSVMSSVNVDYAKDAVKNFQAVYWKRVNGCFVDGQCYSIPTILLPHFRVGDCDLGTVQLAVTSNRVPNLLGVEQLRRIEPWQINTAAGTFTFTCPR